MITTLKDMIDYGTDTLQKAGKQDARSDAWYLLSYCMKIDRTDYYLKQGDPVSSDDIDAYEKLIGIRADGMPLQYITGEQEFMGLVFYVDESVLVPRQDTETLVECVLEHISRQCFFLNDTGCDDPEGVQSESEKKQIEILDMCTGSGCIAISIAALAGGYSGSHERTAVNAAVTASDISPEALEVAKKNAKHNNVDVTFIESDVWNGFSDIVQPDGISDCKRFDIVVSNPPYIRSDDVATLMPEVRCHEPIGALDGGDDGLIFYRRIIDGLPHRLNKGGMVFFEIGYDQADAVSELLLEKGFQGINVVKDLAGLDRVVYGTLTAEWRRKCLNI